MQSKYDFLKLISLFRQFLTELGKNTCYDASFF